MFVLTCLPVGCLLTSLFIYFSIVIGVNRIKTEKNNFIYILINLTLQTFQEQITNEDVKNGFHSLSLSSVVIQNKYSPQIKNIFIGMSLFIALATNWPVVKFDYS